jgi:hypothetical protein
MDESYPAHNEALTDDTLYSIQLNYKWRKLIAGLLEKAWRDDLSSISLDNQDFLSALIQDLYDAETLNMNLFTRFINFALGADRTTTSTTMALVTGSNFSHTPTHNTMLIRVYNLSCFTSIGTSSLTVEIRFNAVAGAIDGFVILSGQAERAVSLQSRFNNVAVGVAHDIGLYFKVSSGTGTLANHTQLIYEITEWDE